MFLSSIRTKAILITIIFVILILHLPIADTAQQRNGIWYRIQKGDTLWDIARTYRVSLKAIRRANPGKSSRKLYAGNKLFLPGVSPPLKKNGFTHKVRKGESVWSIAKRYGVSTKEILVANRLSSGSTLYVGQRLFVPNAKQRQRRTPLTSASRVRKKKTKAVGFSHPLKRRTTVTAGYGKRWHPIYRRTIHHPGIDLRAAVGTRVYPAKAGTVTRAGWHGGYGKLVEIRHTNGYTTRYGHLSKIFVTQGQRVERGQALGKTGNTGISTGPHLHFEIRRNGQSLNPKQFVHF